MRKKKIFVSVATVTVFGVFTRIMGFLFKIYLSRSLGAEAIGQYQMALSVFFLFASLTSGIPLVVSRKTAEKSAVGEKTDFSVISSALLLAALVSLFAILVLTLAKDKLSFLFSDPAAYPIFLVTVPALLVASLYSVIRAYFWGKKEFSVFSATETLEEFLHILLSILLICGVIGGISGAYAVAAAFTASVILIAVILFVIYFVKGGRLTKPSNIKSVLLPSLPITSMKMVSSLMGTLIAFILPLRLIGFGMSMSEATATFGRITGMSNPLILAPNAIISGLTVVLVPEMSANGIKKEYGQLSRQLNTGLNFSFLINGLFMVIYIALGKEITSLLYADVMSGEYLEYAAFIMIPMCIAQMTQSTLNSIGKELASFINYLLGNAVMIVLILILPPYIGIYSVAVANFASLAITSVLNVYTLRKYIGYDCRFMKYLIAVTLFVIPSAFLADCVYSLVGGIPILALLFAALVGVTSYALLCVCTDFVDIKGFLNLRKKRAR